jgi:hypothetical protein
MLYILIRTCPRDDTIGRIAYESLVRLYPDATFVFLAEKGTYKYLVRDAVFRDPADNFGGHAGVRNLLWTLQSMKLPLQDDDLVFLSDADIVAWDSVLNDLKGIDHAGVMTTDRWNMCHISGQFQILRGSFLKRLLTLTNSEIDSVVHDMVAKGIDVADDTFISLMSDRWGLVKKDVCAWTHEKFFEFNGRTDYDTILQTLRSRHMR